MNTLFKFHKIKIKKSLFRLTRTNFWSWIWKDIKRSIFNELTSFLYNSSISVIKPIEFDILSYLFTNTNKNLTDTVQKRWNFVIQNIANFMDSINDWVCVSPIEFEIIWDDGLKFRAIQNINRNCRKILSYRSRNLQPISIRVNGNEGDK